MKTQTVVSNTPVQSTFKLPQAQPPKSARVVIVGGGIVGCSIAYHLAKAGWSDVVLFEQSALSSGTTWHAAGMVGQLRASNSMTQINKYSAWLYPQLEAETGHDVGWVRTRGLTLGTTRERMSQLRRTASMAELFGVEAHVVSPQEAQDYWPLIQTEDVLGAVYLPGDGRVIPGECAVALAKGAQQNGAQLFDRVGVESLITKTAPHGCEDFSRVQGVRYKMSDGTQGEISADWVVLACGMWTRQLGVNAGIDLPLYAVEHHYILSEPIEGAVRDLPCARDPDAAIYFRTLDDGSIKLGAFQARSTPWSAAENVPSDFAFSLLSDDWKKFAEPLAAGKHRIPALREAGFPKFVNGPESFTPDNNFLMGLPARTEGLFVAAGFNSVGIASAGGVGKFTVDWLETGEMPIDLGSVDVRRFGPNQNRASFLKVRSSEVLGLHYQMAWPNREMETGRDTRRSALHSRTSARGAVYGQSAGWERPLFYQTQDAPPGTTRVEYSFQKQNWASVVAAEVNACRNRAALFDQSSFSKFEVSGNDATKALQWLCGNNIDVPVGRLVYTGLFNERGTYQSDLTVVRLDHNRFYLITGTQQGSHDADWILRNTPEGSDLRIQDVTEEYGVVSLMGPEARTILASVTKTEVSHQAFPFGHGRDLKIGDHEVRALRVTYVGELGWEFHATLDTLPSIWDCLLEAGSSLGLVPAGTYAINTMRIEKAYRAFGHELSVDENPFQAGLGFAIDWNKSFLGKKRLEELKEAPLSKKLVSISLETDDPSITLWGNEPILCKDRPVGYTSSGCFSPTLNKPLAMGYLKHPQAEPITQDYLRQGNFKLIQDGKTFPATIHLRAPFDPTREKILR